MSTTTWTDPVTKIQYPIGTEGLEHTIEKDTVLGFIANTVRALYPYAKIPAALAIGLLDWDGNSAVPTYGKWAGPGWGGGERTNDVKWAEPPCYNQNVIGSSDPESCYSLVDAICKTHDWNYYQAETQYGIDHDGLKYEAAIMMADIDMLTSIANALVNQTYTSPTGEYNAGTWTPKTYGGTFDAAETWYVAKLVPSFIAKIALVDTTIEARTAIKTILLSLQTDFDGMVFNDNLCIHKNESASKTNAWIVDLNSTAKPINVNIMYGTGSVKASNVFELPGGNVVRINGGDKNDAIVISGANNYDSMACTFEIAGGGGLDRYYLDKDYNYKLIDSGANEIFIEDGNGGWNKISSLFKQADGTWKSQDGTIALSGNTITLGTGRTIKLNDSFQSGDFGIDLKTLPNNPEWTAEAPVTNYPIVGDFQPIDFDPDPGVTEYHYDTWGNIEVDSTKAAPGRNDTLYDTTANDSISGGAGGDSISLSRGGNNWVWGDGGNDYINSSSATGNNIIDGGTGNDYIQANGGGDDSILGGDGDDTIRAFNAAGNIHIEGGMGNDRIYANRGGREWILGGDGSDYIDSTNAPEDNIFEGGADNDAILGGSGDDKIFGKDYGEKEALIEAGETALSLSGQGDMAYGGEGDDYIYGANTSDLLIGGMGKDLIVGGGGDDYIVGDSVVNSGSVDWYVTLTITDNDYQYTYNNVGGDFSSDTAGDDDLIYAGAGNDVVLGDAGEDEIYGGIGNDTVFAEAGSDFIEGGDGNDMLIGDNGDFLAAELNGNDYIDGGAGNDSIFGNGGNDDLFGGADNDTIDGGDGDDYLDGEAGLNTLYGGAGDDEMFGGDEADLMEGDYIGTVGNDYLDGLGGNDTLSGSGGADTIFGGEGNDQLHGDAGDVALANQGDDYVDGEGGDDYLCGYGGNDEMFGGAGNDSLYGMDGDDYLDGEDGDDYLYGDVDKDVMFGGDGADTLYGMDGDDYLDGEDGLNSLYGGGGNDTIFGGDENDRLEGDHIDSTQGNDYLDGLGGDDTLIGAGGADTLFGGEGNDQLYGDGAGIADGDDYLDGKAGDDILLGGGGNDTYLFGRGYGNDMIVEVAGANINTIVLGADIATTDVTLSKSGNNLLISIVGTTDILTVENWFEQGGALQTIQIQFTDGPLWDVQAIRQVFLTSTVGNDYIQGFVGNDTIDGGLGNDIIFGDAGDDLIHGGADNDSLWGEEGNDTIYGGEGDDVIYFNDAGYENTGNNLGDGGAGNDWLDAGFWLDTLYGGLGNDTLRCGEGGHATMIGGIGDDYYCVDNEGDVIIEYADEGYDYIYVWGDLDIYTMGDNVEEIFLAYGYGAVGNSLDNTMTGTWLSGEGGNDYLTGMEMYGGLGDDYLKSEAGYGDRLLDGGAGNDYLVGASKSADTYVFGRGYENDRISDYSTNSDLNDTILLKSDIQTSDVILLRNYNDLVLNIVGSSDTLTVSSWFDVSGYYTVEQIQFAVDGTIWDVAYIEAHLLPSATEGDDTLTGTANADNMAGLGGNDYLSGLAGDDTIDGGTGADTISGGPGNDYLQGNTGNDMYMFNRGDGVDTIVNYAEDGATSTDTVMFGPGITLADLDFIKQERKLQINIRNTTDTLIIKDQIGTSDNFYVDQFWFTTDNSVMTAAQIAANGFIINGTSGADYLYGEGGADRIYGYEGNDTLCGYDGNDTLCGGDGNDYLEGDDGSDTLCGGAGNDYLEGDYGDDVYVFERGSGNDRIDNHSWDYDATTDTVMFGSGITPVDLEVTKAGNDFLIHINGTEDTLTIGSYFYSGWYRVDQYKFSDNTTLTVNQLEAKLSCTLLGGDGNDTISGTYGNDTIYGYAGNDNLYGSGGDDAIYGGDGDDTITGGDGDDILNGLAGSDSLTGNNGSDTLDGGLGNDTLNGGLNSDYSDYDTYVFSLGSGTDTIINPYGHQNDIVSFGAAITANNLDVTRVGDDLQIKINGTTDTLIIKQWFSITYYHKQAGLFKFADDTTLTASEMDAKIVATPTEGNDNLTGTSGTDNMSGLAGNDMLTALAGNDTLDGGTGIDTMLGGTGNDIYIVDNSGDVITENASEGIDTVNSSITYTLSNNVENLTLTGTSSIIGTGNTLDNYLTGNSAVNTLTGSSGNDTLDGAAGNDSLVGGTGNDTYIFARGYGQDTINDTDTTAGNLDKITLAADIAPADVTLRRSGDNLIASINNTTDSVTVQNWFVSSGANRVEQIVFDGGTVWDVSYIQANATTGGTSGNDNLTGTTGADLLSGLAGNDTLTGLDGDDTLDGGIGADSMVGGAGNDTYIRDNTSDVIVEGSSAGTDTVLSNLTYTLGSNVENLTLTGTSAINGTGNTLANYLTGNSSVNKLTGSSGNDTLDGGAGADSLVGGTGNDTYIVDNTGDKVTESSSSGTDTVLSSVTYTLPSNVEYLTLTGTGAINATGNTMNNRITGNSANNTLSGGSGSDTMIGGSGNDIYIVNSTGDVVTENANEGVDTVQSTITLTLGANVENLTLTGTSTIKGTGNTLDNYLKGNSAVNTLTGNAGNDTLDGGAGADSLVGGTGDDTYIVDNTSDKITESTGAGTDTVRSSVAHTLGSNVENLTLTGTSAINGTGNTLNNVLTGNSGVNTLTGNAGNDTLDGGLGNDSLVGGTGNDAYTYRRTDGQDTINDYSTTTTDIDALQLTDGIATTEPVIVKQNGDLYIFVDTGNYVKIASQFTATTYGIERLEVSDGHYITRSDIESIVNTMSVINNNTGMDVMQKYNAMMQDQTYISTLAAPWKQM